jgi:signal transduction histidine kinase
MSQDVPSQIPSRFERLVQAGIAISAQHTLQAVLSTVADSLRELVGARYAAVGILDETGKALSAFATSGVSDEEADRIGSFPTGRGVLGLLIHEPKPLRLGNIRDNPASVGFPDHHPEMRSFLGVPVMGRNGPMGNLYVTEKIGADEFTEQDEAVATMFAAQVAVAVENARLYEETSRLLSEIRELHTSREQFFATINHELRNALTAVHGWSDLLLRKLGPSAPQAAREVFESAENTLELLDDLLLLNRIHQARVVPAPREFEIRERIESAVSFLSATAREKGVSIELKGDPDGALCYTDSQRLYHLLTNLVAYAVRHCPANESVGVSLAVGDERFRVDVSYGGPEIDPEIQKIIFEQYVPGDTSRERGTGLGLPLARSLARLLGGDVHVENRTGGGTLFRLELPRKIKLD